MKMRFKISWTLLLLMISHHLVAQLCQGSLGDPIVNITFGAGVNPGPPLSAAATGYQYLPQDCPNDGLYTVRNQTTACYNNTWHTLASDHTGNTNGYFMLVNASFQPSAFYLDTVRGLCGNTVYEFAAWIMNVITPSSCNGNTISPNLSFQIEKTDGSIIQTYNTGNIPAQAGPLWRQYGFYFTTPATATDIVLRMINNAPGGCGNDLALDDISFRPCGPLLSPSITGMQSTTAILCEGTAGSFNFSCGVSGGFINPAFQWQQSTNGSAWTDIPGATTTSLVRNFTTSSPAGIYSFRLSVAESGNMGSAQCRIASPILTVQVSSNPVTTAINNGPACDAGSLLLTASGGTQYLWSGPNGFSASGSPITIEHIQLNAAGKYYVIVKNAAGCEHTDSTMVIIHPAPTAATSFVNASICEDSTIILSANGGTRYEWIPANGLSDANMPATRASPPITTRYMVIVSNNHSCSDTAFVDINVIPKPYVNAGPDRLIFSGQSIQLSATTNSPGNHYSWSPPDYINDIHSLQPTINPPADAQYILNAVSDFGCGVSADTMFVKVYNGVFVPNAFSPNGDSRNDTWNVPALGAYSKFELSIFNRYGERVFYLKDVNHSWDGNFKGLPLPVGTYCYFIDLKNQAPMMKGTVTIIR